MSKGIKIFVAIPSTGIWQADFGMALLFMFGHMVGTDVYVYVNNRKGSIIQQSREEMTQKALDIGADYILFIYSDQTFPANLLTNLLKANRAIVACNIATKQLPAQPTARKNVTKENPEGEIVRTLPESSGLEQVDRVGCGIMLIKTHVFKKKNQPWYPQEWNGKHIVGEDWGFCKWVKEAGFKIFIDHDVSKEVGHIGNFTYTHEYVLRPGEEIAA